MINELDNNNIILKGFEALYYRNYYDDEIFKVTNDQEAEWIIEKANEDLIEINRFRKSLEEKLEVIRQKINKLYEEENRVKEWRDSYLLEYFETIDEKFKKKTKTMEKYRLPSGEIIKKYQSPEYKRDEDKLLSWIENNKLNNFVEVKKSAKWSELKKATKIVGEQVVFNDTGEVVDGVELINRPPVIEFKEV